MPASVGKATYLKQNSVNIIVGNMEQNIKDSWFGGKSPYCLKMKIDFKYWLPFKNRIIHEKLWKGNEGDVPWWQWQESSKKLQSQQNINKTQSEGDGAEGGETEWGQKRQ